MNVTQVDNFNNKCIGCGACVDICPVNSLSLVENEYGFLYPSLNAGLCVDCGKCVSICPIKKEKFKPEEQHLFASYATDKIKHNQGSSGGVFGILAEHFIDEGYSVCGAAFDENLQLKHRLIRTKEDLKALTKSKYIQSNTESIFDKIAHELKDNKKVFFVGTPCQCESLLNYIPQKHRDNLFIADFICHGVPSQYMFNEYIKSIECEKNCKVTEFHFRTKNNGAKEPHCFTYKTVDNKNRVKTVKGDFLHSTYYNAFKHYCICRESCYECPYATIERASDITLADFWGIEKYDKKLNITDSVSMIITNTSKGHRFFKEVSSKLYIKEYPVQYGIDSNFCLTNYTIKPDNYDAIFKCFKENGYSVTAQRFFRASKKEILYSKLPNFVTKLYIKLFK